MNEQQGKSRVYVFRHRVERCGAESLVSAGRLPESDEKEVEITCRACREPYRVKKADATGILTPEEAREVVGAALRAQGLIDEESPL